MKLLIDNIYVLILIFYLINSCLIREKIYFKFKLNLKPYPYIFIKKLLDKNLLKVKSNSPSFEDLNSKEILYQSKSQTKKTIID